MNTKNIIKSIFLFVLVMSLIKTDYRLVSEINCCSDDFEYFIHSQTIVEDRDFDYSNQIIDSSKARFRNGDKIAPAGFVGSGIMASPFYFLGYILNRLFEGSPTFNFIILFYSLSSIFYLFLSLYLLIKSIELINPKANRFFLTLIFFGSGISYYAFERYSMTHVYEVFITSLLIYLSLIFSRSKLGHQSNIYAFSIPLVVLLGILCRWTNYYFFILPFVINMLHKLKQNNSNILYKNKYLYVSGILSIFIFTLLSQSIYGLVTYNPQVIYSSNRLENFLVINFDFFITNAKNFFLLFVTNEFGILWTVPCIALSIILCFYQNIKRRNLGLNFIILLIFAQVVLAVLLWSTTASSYGFRYLYSLIPFSIFYIYYTVENIEETIFFKILLGLSIVGFISYLFFETTTFTQLSTDKLTNSFGKADVPYSQPLYMTGVLKSIISVEAYLKIFANGFLVALVLKILLYIIDYEALLDILGSLGLPSENESFIKNLDSIVATEVINLILFFFINSIFIYLTLNFVNKKNQLS